MPYVILRSCLIYLALFFLFYGIVGFVTLDWNVFEWEQRSRSGLLMASFMSWLLIEVVRIRLWLDEN